MNEDRQMNAQIIVTPAGERLAVLPEADYLALIEATQDIADRDALQRFRSALERGDEEMLPAEMVERLLAGESPVRVWREHRKLTAQGLADATGMAASYISQIETGKRDGTLETMLKIAGALGVLVDDLLNSGADPRAGETENRVGS